MSRWNVLAAGRTGIELELLPMLLGFFTYKAALVARQSVALFDELSGKAPFLQFETLQCLIYVFIHDVLL